MDRIPESELEYPGDDGLYYYAGKRFTGIAYRMGAGGQVQSEVEYRDGAAWGRGQIWFASGARAEAFETAQGVIHGLRRRWHESGGVALEEMFEHGICLWRKQWDEGGSPIEDYKLSPADRDFRCLEVLRKYSGGTGLESAPDSD